MKLVLSWIFDHIAVSRKEIDPQALFERINVTTAEVDAVAHIHTDLSTLFVARIVSVSSNDSTLECPELRKSITLPSRKDSLPVQGAWVLLKKEGNAFRYATLTDVGSEKDGLMPLLALNEDEATGAWRDKIEADDYVLTIDNAALTNRPDLWGHRGFAREIAAILGKNLRAEDEFLATKTIKHFEHESHGSHAFTLAISQDSGDCGSPCKRLGGYYISQLTWQPSILPLAIRLARVDSRPLDALVDMTNYVMWDIGQPMHAFDADALVSKKLVGRCAHDGEKLKLLDGEEVTLTGADYVMTDGAKPVALAGIMGGADSAVQQKTHSLLIEAANFDARTIRRSSTRLKKRTESSVRFEKSLDPNQNTTALLRYLKLLENAGINYTGEASIISIGHLAHDKKIELSHSFIEKKLGVSIPHQQIEQVLTRLGFGVQLKTVEEDLQYIVTVPPFRSSKDVTIKEDIVEEVARFIGYSAIAQHFPMRPMIAFDTRGMHRMRAIKKFLAFGLQMHEVQTYAFYDEEFLAKLHYDPQDALRIANPQSEHWQRLITSLVPNLMKCIATNPQQEKLSFFEHNRVWFYEEKPIETQECAGLWYEQKRDIDFYEGKASLEMVFDLLKLSIRWEKPQQKSEPWYDPHRTAELWHEDRIIGRAGSVYKPFLHTIAEGDAFIFELDANVLMHGEGEPIHFKALKKYPSTDLDISMLVPVQCTVEGIESIIVSADTRIKAVSCVDRFEKAEWGGKKSLTFRFTVYDDQGTMTKEIIDGVWHHVVEKVRAIGAEVR